MVRRRGDGDGDGLAQPQGAKDTEDKRAGACGTQRAINIVDHQGLGFAGKSPVKASNRLFRPASGFPITRPVRETRKMRNGKKNSRKK